MQSYADPQNCATGLLYPSKVFICDILFLRKQYTKSIMFSGCPSVRSSVRSSVSPSVSPSVHPLSVVGLGVRESVAR